MPKAYLSLGSNLGDKRDHLRKAVYLLKKNNHITVSKCSSFYETKPVGYTAQDNFINIVVEIETTLTPYQLLDVCQDIEHILKRKRLIRWGPRTIDLDILLFDNFISSDEKLTIPHPRMLERAFVMIPLNEIAPILKINNLEIEMVVKEMNKELQKNDIQKLDEESISI